MEKPFIIVSIIVGVAAFIGFAIYLSYKYEKERTEKIRKLAQELGLQFDAEAASSIRGEVDGMRLFNQGHGRKFKNMLHGNANGVDMAIFEYHYTVGHGKHQSHSQQSVVYFRSPNMRTPHFELRPEHLFHKIGQAFGYKDIDFDSHPEFSKRYLLRGEDEEAIRNYFTPARLEFFESLNGVCVEAQTDRLVFYRQSKRIKPDEVRQLMTEGFRVYKQLETSVG